MSNEPVIAYRSIITASNVSTNNSVAGFPVAALANGLTYDRYFADSAAGQTLIEIDAGSPVLCDALGIAAHNLDKFPGLAITVLGGSTYPAATVVADYDPETISSGAPALRLFTGATYRYWAVLIEWTLPAPSLYPFVSIGAFYLGARLTFERCLMKSHAPAPYNRVTDFYDNSSESGQFLGRSIMRRGFSTEVSFDMASAAWVRSQFQPFVKAARLSPYFFAWAPGTYPDEVVFGRTAKDIGVDYTGDRDRMKANWQIEGLGFDD